MPNQSSGISTRGNTLLLWDLKQFKNLSRIKPLHAAVVEFLVFVLFKKELLCTCKSWCVVYAIENAIYKLTIFIFNPAFCNIILEWIIYERNHINIELWIWNQVKLWSLQLYECNFGNCLEKPDKFRTSTGFEPMTLRCQCDALNNWAMKPVALGVGHLWVLLFPWWMNPWMKWHMKGGHRFKPCWSPECFMFLYTIAKITFITAKINSFT